MTEMVDHARAIAVPSQLPVIADADTGYGKSINVVRTVQEFEQAGVAALHLEDQVAPKRCGHLDGKQMVPMDEMVSKIRAAVAARTAPELVLVARTDAAAVGIDAAIDRARRYHDAGVDALFVEAVTSEADIEGGRCASELADVPLLLNWVEGGKTPPLPYDRLRELGFAIVIFPLTTLLTAMTSMRHALAQIRTVGTPTPLLEDLPSFSAFTEFIGLDEITRARTSFHHLTRRPTRPASRGWLSPPACPGQQKVWGPKMSSVPSWCGGISAWSEGATAEYRNQGRHQTGPAVRPIPRPHSRGSHRGVVRKGFSAPTGPTDASRRRETPGQRASAESSQACSQRKSPVRGGASRIARSLEAQLRNLSAAIVSTHRTRT